MDVVAAILRDHDKVFIAKRSSRMQNSGYWEFPGGKVEPGETLAQALVRELDEEVSIAVETFFLWKVKKKMISGADVRIHFFFVTKYSGEPVPKEGQEFAWAGRENAEHYTFLPADKEIFLMLVESGHI